MSAKYEERLTHDQSQIEGLVKELADRVEVAVKASQKALVDGDKALAYDTILNDLPINRMSREVDAMAHRFVARHMPSAGHLRFVSSVIRMNIGLERIGDYAATVCRHVARMKEPLSHDVAPPTLKMGEDAIEMLQQAMQAFFARDVDLARETKGFAKRVDDTFAKAYKELVEDSDIDLRPSGDLFSALSVMNAFERVSDQAKNICEETIFIVTGDTKPPKTYSILFLEKSDNGASQLARAIAERGFPNSGSYRTAGSDPVSALTPGLESYVEEKGLELTGTPTALSTLGDLSGTHVIVGLGLDAANEIAPVPYETIIQNWNLPPSPKSGATSEEQTAAFDNLHKELSTRIADLMTTMRGEDAP